MSAIQADTDRQDRLIAIGVQMHKNPQNGPEIKNERKALYLSECEYY